MLRKVRPLSIAQGQVWSSTLGRKGAAIWDAASWLCNNALSKVITAKRTKYYHCSRTRRKLFYNLGSLELLLSENFTSLGGGVCVCLTWLATPCARACVHALFFWTPFDLFIVKWSAKKFCKTICARHAPLLSFTGEAHIWCHGIKIKFLFPSFAFLRKVRAGSAFLWRIDAGRRVPELIKFHIRESLLTDKDGN